jgi:tRNA A37 threonylcarbamoyladenosine modification protein TsaB
MHILLVQTACNYHQVVLYSDESGSENVIADWHQDKPRETLSFLMKVLSELEQFPKPELIVFVQGPGSFTALRVGATWVNTFAYAQSVPIVSLNSLQFLAYLIHQDSKDLALTFDQKRYFVQENGAVIATEQNPSGTVVNPDQIPVWFTSEHINKLSSLFSPPTKSTEVLYVIPPKITLPKER